MGKLKNSRQTSGCPFYGFYYSDKIQLIPVNYDNCALRRFLRTRDDKCIMEDTSTGPYFQECSIAKKILEVPGNWEKFQKLDVLTFNLDFEKGGAPIVPFRIWFKHVLERVSLDSLIENK
ncbi:MAG: hypothetical protein ACOC1P_05665 [Minisyncoccales bacterium]